MYGAVENEGLARICADRRSGSGSYGGERTGQCCEGKGL